MLVAYTKHVFFHIRIKYTCTPKYNGIDINQILYHQTVLVYQSQVKKICQMYSPKEDFVIIQ